MLQIPLTFNRDVSAPFASLLIDDNASTQIFYVCIQKNKLLNSTEEEEIIYCKIDVEYCSMENSEINCRICLLRNRETIKMGNICNRNQNIKIQTH